MLDALLGFNGRIGTKARYIAISILLKNPLLLPKDRAYPHATLRQPSLRSANRSANPIVSIVDGIGWSGDNNVTNRWRGGQQSQSH
jgi:hypothetical protein